MKALVTGFHMLYRLSPDSKYPWSGENTGPIEIPVLNIPLLVGAVVVVYYCRTYMKAVRGGGVKRGDVCYGMLRAAACVDESDHHALMYVWHGQTVREDRVGEASARRP